MSLLQELGEKQSKVIALSPDIVKNFKTGIIWKAIENEIEGLLIDTWRELEVTEDAVMYHQLQGRARCLREMLMFFETLEIHAEQEMEVNDAGLE